MNKNSKNRKAGQFSQGNKMYLSAYQKTTRKCRKIMLDYAKSEFAIDPDDDKLAFIFESEPFLPQQGAAPVNLRSTPKPNKRGAGSVLPLTVTAKKEDFSAQENASRYYVLAMYDTQRIVLIQFNDTEMFEGEDDRQKEESVYSGVTGSSIVSKYLTDSQLSGGKDKKKKKKAPKSLKSKIIYYDDLFAIEKGEETVEQKQKVLNETRGGVSPQKPKTLRDLLADNPNFDEEQGDKQIDFENIIQNAQILYPKLYLWNENAIKVFQFKFTMDLNQLIKQD